MRDCRRAVARAGAGDCVCVCAWVDAYVLWDECARGRAGDRVDYRVYVVGGADEVDGVPVWIVVRVNVIYQGLLTDLGG